MDSVFPNNRALLTTRRALIQQKADSTFVGRKESLSELMRLLVSPAECGFANLYGISGIGKSTLLSKLLAAGKLRGSICYLIDLAFCRSQISLLVKLSEGLSAPFLEESKSACLHVRSRYVRLHRKLVESHALSPSLVAQISRLSEFDSSETDAGAGTHDELAPASLAVAQDQLGADYHFFRDPTSDLARALVLDINALADTRPTGTNILIALDRSEAVPETLLTWFRDEVFLDLAAMVALVVAGQRHLTHGWDTLLQPGLSIELKQMSVTEVTALADNFAIRNPDAVDWIFRASDGVPLLAEEFCRSYLSDPRIIEIKAQLARPSEAVVNRYLESIAAPYREVVQKAALLRNISSENAREILGAKDAAAIMAVINTVPYVVEGPRGFVMHDRVRAYLNRHFHTHNPTAHAEICAKAADYFASRRAGGIEVFESLTEELYYRVCANGDAGLDCLCEGFSRFALLNQPQECETLVEIAVQAGLGAAAWIAHFRAVILYQRSEYRASLDGLVAILEDVTLDLDDALRQQVLFYCAVDNWYLCQFAEAMAYARRALEAYRPTAATKRREAELASYYDNRSLGIIALTQDRMGCFAQGIDSANKMAALARTSHDLSSLGYALNSAGYFSWHEGNWQASDAYLAESIETWRTLRSEFGSCYPLGHRAALRTMVGDADYGIKAIVRCITLCKARANREMQCKAGYAHAEALWGAGRYQESAACAAEAIELARAIGQRYFAADALRVRAAASLMLGDQAVADEALRESLELSATISAPYIRRRAEAIAYASGLHDALKLPDFDLVCWVRAAGSEAFGRAVLDLGRVAVRTSTIVRLAAGQAPAVLLGGALTFNFNAFLILAREMKETGLSVPSLQEVAGIAANGFAAPATLKLAEDARALDFVERATRRGLKGNFNAVEWNSAIETLGGGPKRKSRRRNASKSSHGSN